MESRKIKTNKYKYLFDGKFKDYRKQLINSFSYYMTLNNDFEYNRNYLTKFFDGFELFFSSIKFKNNNYHYIMHKIHKFICDTKNMSIQKIILDFSMEFNLENLSDEQRFEPKTVEECLKYTNIDKSYICSNYITVSIKLKNGESFVREIGNDANSKRLKREELKKLVTEIDKYL